MVPTRRSLLTSAGAALLAGVAGCLSESTQPTTSPESETPRDEQTPPPSDCDADRPHPATGDRLPDPRDYPEGPPELAADPVRSFLREYEAAFAYNRLLSEVAGSGNCVRNIGASVTEVTVEAADAGFTAHVETFGSYTGEVCDTATGTDTATPLPHADYALSADYHVTDRFLLRDGEAVACW